MKTISQRSRFAIAGMLLAASGTTASADWNEFWHQSHIDYHRSHAYPEPFGEVDAMKVTEPFEVMKHNGWRLHNTIGHELFRDGDAALLASGHNRIHWIATQAPQSERNVYVLRGKSDAETDARVAAVEETLASMQLSGPRPQVFVTDKEPSTASGAWAVQVNRDWMEVLAKPMLPSKTAREGGGAATSQ